MFTYVEALPAPLDGVLGARETVHGAAQPRSLALAHQHAPRHLHDPELFYYYFIISDKIFIMLLQFLCAECCHWCWHCTENVYFLLLPFQ